MNIEFVHNVFVSICVCLSEDGDLAQQLRQEQLRLSTEETIWSVLLVKNMKNKVMREVMIRSDLPQLTEPLETLFKDSKSLQKKPASWMLSFRRTEFGNFMFLDKYEVENWNSNNLNTTWRWSEFQCFFILWSHLVAGVKPEENVNKTYTPGAKDFIAKEKSPKKQMMHIL